MKPWFVYIVRCSDESLYTGVTIDITRRLDEHNHDNRLGAKYTRARRPVSLVFQRQFSSRSEACQYECEIKRMTKLQKMQLTNSQ